MNKKIFSVVILGGLLLFLTGCKHERKTNDIITTMAPKPKVPKGPIALHNYTYKKKVKWLGNSYTIIISRQADKGLELIEDEDGRKYYDNKVDLKVLHSDGSTFYSKTFTKADFHAFCSEKYVKEGAFIGFMFDTIDLNTIKFGASIGSPNPQSDEYVPLEVTLDNLGHISIAESSELDGSSPDSPSKPKDMISAAEEDGV